MFEFTKEQILKGRRKSASCDDLPSSLKDNENFKN